MRRDAMQTMEWPAGWNCLQGVTLYLIILSVQAYMPCGEVFLYVLTRARMSPLQGFVSTHCEAYPLLAFAKTRPNVRLFDSNQAVQAVYEIFERTHIASNPSVVIRGKKRKSAVHS